MAELNHTQWQTLRGASWFGSLSSALQEAIVRAASIKSYPSESRVYRHGEAGHAWFGVLRGAVKISGLAPDGREIAIVYIEPGNWIGELSLFDGEPRTHDGIAQGETEILVVAAAAFHTLCDEHPEMLRAIIRLQSARLRKLLSAIKDINALPLDVRIAKHLVTLAHTHGKKSEQGIDVTLKLAQEDVAQLVGASRQRVNQELKRMERDGLISARYGKLVIRDEVALEKLAAA
jgi:CRP/FNR family transcriptional regulator, cyclic AMP receptor protein